MTEQVCNFKREKMPILIHEVLVMFFESIFRWKGNLYRIEIYNNYNGMNSQTQKSCPIEFY